MLFIKQVTIDTRLELLNKRRVWIDRLGHTHRLQTMSPEYLRALAAWLERRAASQLTAEFEHLMLLQGEMASISVEQAVDELSNSFDAAVAQVESELKGRK